MHLLHSRSRGVRLVGALAALTLVTAACGSDSTSTGSEATTTIAGGDATDGPTIVAKGVKWDVDRLEIAAGETVTITVDNDDDNIPHNLHVKVPDGEGFKTAIENGPVTQHLEVSIAEPGDYTFVCDVHPNMKGTLVVS